MKKETIVFWFVGTNAAGKSTQAALLHKYLRQSKYFQNKLFSGEESGIKWKFTQCSEASANLGNFNHPLLITNGDKTLDCCGTDTLSTKAQIIRSFKEAKKNFSIITVEGVMATGQWFKFLSTPDTHLCMILCDIELEVCLKRLKKRRANKHEINIFNVEDFSEKTIENISGKVRGFKSLWNNIAHKCDSRLLLNVNSYDKYQLNEQIIHFFENHILVDL
jgi:thymidylate kinase